MDALHNKARPRALPSEQSAFTGFVQVRGAREHNLKNVDVQIPRDALVVFTGVSGSGKSSLAFGTLYAEAQRRYFESVAPYARRLIDQVGVPEVDAIEGLPPAVALQQQRGAPSARSSVGSVTTLSSLVRMLYSRTGDYPPKQPMLFAEDFSPNTVQGACPTCHGLGRVYEVTEQSMVPDDSRTIRERAIAAWPPAWHGQNLRDILVTLGYDVDKPWRDLPKKDRDWILFTNEQPTVPVYAGLTPKETRAALKRKDEPSYQGTFTGARRYVLHTFANSQSALMKKRVSQFMVGSVCPSCHGKRLKKEALSVTFAGLDIGAFSQLSLAELAELLEPIARGEWPEPDAADAGKGAAKGTGNGTAKGSVLSRTEMRDAVDKRVAAGGSAHKASPDVRRTPNLSTEKRVAAQRIAAELLERLTTLVDLGLGYLSLERSTPTLSSGELQRLRLATQLASQLFGVVYVLDEPSAGLHPADGEALFSALNRLKAAGNSLFVVEHDLQMMRRADWLVDVGPAAGEAGGHVVYSGPPAGLANVQASQTGAYLFAPSEPAARVPREPAGWLRLAGITRNNLHELDAAFPLGCLTAVTGVSGSGKSSLVSQALPELVASHLGRALDNPDEDEQDPLLAGPSTPTGGRITEGMDALRRLVRVDQKPIGRTPRSNLATYTGLFDHVRKLFADTPLARKRRYGASRFSFNVAQGRCPTCEGEGFVSVELLFLPSVYAPCSTCQGTRYNPQTLEVTWRDKNIAEVLGMTVGAACDFFADEPSVMRALNVLRDIGLGYLRLGQPATELSGGEAQRIKLATELQRAQRGDTLYILDEPTTGLHPADVDRLMLQLQGLVEAGNTVVLVEHDMRVAAQSDWVIDVGPHAGEAGGKIVASGTPEEVARAKESRTAEYLRQYLVA
ncbi:excinuclease ABC subunit UvrA [bacterium M00.F.Ca.ET.228.01.1.1]|uniref:excinuclease ABC subunit UvrA n=1 Tax=Paraburkholderia phenoliruptrix TaxID=252970 RepID=UPI001091C305|nr:excinuclease ABC subunit UvrA [Paraburkholderia phenoliruptrix]TGP42468.1 excinuclease ABC subunit UvrA [bacterium M00.F.Ca.ET.228.01.1.1]TGS00119.1 excinuclease ABC subunit UvrA [bacterium M00.F.Ca.ET.191.01.1.1]TGU04439.1 excinuclease ABC subunit UvrA [bacterium M00.F.Ca.ET.155.01.1.1]MBW0449947.1 excinuclease ABC subunit UvrA [Paraburkholderia phenoliruptrix]MBW9098699.1 excinuclease ABC subunit UvrA [Paraburkholderia phenoliruptrix]